MKILPKVLFIVLIMFSTSLFGAEGFPVYNITDFGAKADGKTKNTDVFKAAIAEVKKAGGGTVYVPPGEYLTGPIHFVDNMTLYVEAGSVVKFSTDFDDYLPMVQTRFQGVDYLNFSPLLYAYQVNNIAIRGRGKIDGQGKRWHDFWWEFWGVYSKGGKKDRAINKWQMMTWEANPSKTPMHGGFMRPQLLLAYECNNVLLEDVKIRNSPCWVTHFVLCENVDVIGVNIVNPPSFNPDGINPESCKNVRIANCYIETDDDAICIKAGAGAGARWEGNSCENITITNCTVVTNAAAGVAIGDEMSGDIRNMTISNCVFSGVTRGINFKSTRGKGGIVENITVDNIIMNNVSGKWGDYTIELDMTFWVPSTKQPISDDTPKFRNIHFSNISGSGNKGAIWVRGLEEMPMDNISFTNINLGAKKGVVLEHATNVRFTNVTINADSGAALYATDISGIEINGFSTTKNMGDTPLLQLDNVRNAFIHDTFLPNGIKAFLKLSDKRTSNIYIGTEDTRRFSEGIIYNDGLKENAVIN